MIYLDNSATTSMAPEVLDRIAQVRRETFGNASSVHRIGQRARAMLDESRATIARMIGAEPREIVFTSGGTEANNAAIKGYAFASSIRHRAWPAIITARTEHHSVLGPAEYLERLGAPVRYVEVDADGRTRPEALRAALDAVDRSIPPLVSLMHANNETGAINPIEELAGIAHAAGAIVHTDVVQSFAKVVVGPRALGADMLTLSSHKFHGPRGIGVLYLRKEIEIEPLIHGGAQERNRRGGTEPVDLIVGLVQAARLALDSLDTSASLMSVLRERLGRGLASAIEGIRTITPGTHALPNILSVTFDDAAQIDGEALIVGMDIRGVAVSNGSACSSGSSQPSHVLLAMGLPPAQARAAVRFSLSRYTTEADVDEAVGALADVVRTMRDRCRQK